MVEKLRAEYDIELEWRPFYLFWDTPPEGRELPEHVKQARAKGSEERLSQIASSYGMKFVSTKRIYNTRLAHEATEYAREHGKASEFHPLSFAKSMPRAKTSASGMCCVPLRKKSAWMRTKCKAK